MIKKEEKTDSYRQDLESSRVGTCACALISCYVHLTKQINIEI